MAQSACTMVIGMPYHFVSKLVFLGQGMRAVRWGREDLYKTVVDTPAVLSFLVIKEFRNFGQLTITVPASCASEQHVWTSKRRLPRCRQGMVSAVWNLSLVQHTCEFFLAQVMVGLKLPFEVLPLSVA